MRYSVSEMAKMTGVSVRTLHYYDEIGLLAPSEIISETGYRYYDEHAIEKLQQIMFYRELDFKLKDIIRILNSKGYNKEDALLRQRKLLVMKMKRLEGLVKLIDDSLKGENNMSFKEFEMDEINEAKEKYAKEVQEKWGQTAAYEEYSKKTKGNSKEDWSKSQAKADEIMKKFAKHLGEKPDSIVIQDLVEEWKNYITENYYTCTNEILSGLSQMYVADERFTKNMDKFGEGTAKLMSDAIAIYCKAN